MRPRWKFEDKVVDYAMEVDCAKMVDYIRQVNDRGSKQLATLPQSGLTNIRAAFLFILSSFVDAFI